MLFISFVTVNYIMVCDNNAAHNIPFFEDQKAARTCVGSEQH